MTICSQDRVIQLERDLKRAMKYAEVIEGDEIWKWFQARIAEQQPKPANTILQRIKARQQKLNPTENR